MLGFCMCTHKPSGTLDVNKALDYCAEQTQRTLTELKTDSGIDYTMMPRNIMADEHHWNCRKATKEEWCAGFWPGVLWYDYEYTQDKHILEEAKKFTNSLEFLSQIPESDLKAEYLLPTIIGELLKEQKVEVKVLKSHDKWFGVTYKEDKEAVVEAIRSLVANGVYPEKLFG